MAAACEKNRFFRQKVSKSGPPVAFRAQNSQNSLLIPHGSFAAENFRPPWVLRSQKFQTPPLSGFAA